MLRSSHCSDFAEAVSICARSEFARALSMRPAIWQFFRCRWITARDGGGGA
jgi:hypothetical protein